MMKSTAGLAVAAALIASVAFVPGRAEATTSMSAAAVRAAASGLSVTAEARTVCRRIWRCGVYRCGWRRVCAWRPGRQVIIHRKHGGFDA